MTSWPHAAREVIAVHEDARTGGLAGAASPTSTDEDGLEDSRTLERSLRGVVRCLQRALEEVDPPITPVRLWCLRELQEHPGTTVGDVAATVGVAPSTVSRPGHRLHHRDHQDPLTPPHGPTTSLRATTGAEHARRATVATCG